MARKWKSASGNPNLRQAKKRSPAVARELVSATRTGGTQNKKVRCWFFLSDPTWGVGKTVTVDYLWASRIYDKAMAMFHKFSVAVFS
jgi:hypothetical protein